MRIILSLLLIQISLSLFSSTTLVEKNINWINDNDIKFLYPDSTPGDFSYIEELENKFDIKPQVEFLTWDTLNIKAMANRQYSGAFGYSIISYDFNNKNFAYKLKLNTVYLTPDSQIIRLKSFRIVYNLPVFEKKSVLSSGKWHKIKVTKSGIYKISFSQLKKMGFDNPDKINLFGYAMGMLPNSTSEPFIDDLKNIPVLKDASNIYFYGRDAIDRSFNSTTGIFEMRNNKYSDTTYYFLTDSKGGTRTIESVNPVSFDFIEVQDYDDIAFRENDEINILNSGSEWFGDRMTNHQQVTANFNFPNLNTNDSVLVYFNVFSKSAVKGTMKVNVSSTEKTFTFPVNNVNSDLSGGFITSYFKTKNTSNNVKVVFEYINTDENASGYINYMSLNVKRNLIFNNELFIFRNKANFNSSKDLKYIINKVSGDLKIWDITDENYPKNVELTTNGNQVSFISKSGEIRNYIAFGLNASGIMEPIIDAQSMVQIPNQDIHAAEVPDLIIISPDSASIYEQAGRLAQFRQNNDGLKVLLLKISEVYNEFSSGRRDATAIRNMVRYFYTRSIQENKKFSYLLLFGDGTFVNKLDNETNLNLLPTYESSESFLTDASYVADDYYGWMNYNSSEEGNLLSIGVGRLPVKNYSEATDLVNKIIAYSNPSNDDDWRNIICFIADDEDGNSHLRQSDELAQSIRSNYKYFDLRKIYLDSYVQIKTASGESYPDANTAINDRINSGALIVNYTGHGNEKQLAHENIINVKSIADWSNTNKYPMFITATCEFSRWDDYDFSEKKEKTSAGENVLLNPGGGAVAMLTTTRLVYSESNFDLNKAFYKYAFDKDEDGNDYRIGDLFRLTKNDKDVRGINRINFSLLGDPSLMLGGPRQVIIKTDSINNRKLNDTLINDTLKALSITTVSGHFDKNGSIFPYNGNLSVKVFDKPDTLNTLANDEGSNVQAFARQEATIFKGIVNVVDGCFNFKFPIPLDIKLNIAQGKIIYFAPSKEGDFGGYSEEFKIGGVADNNDNNYQGPIINLYMNDTNFRNGGITNSSPKLLVHLRDNDGINASGIGIGHDITAILDNDYSKMISLNSNYRTELNDYKRGATTYSFSGLTAGKHTIKVVAWDIFNNSFENEINFHVLDNTEMVLSNVYNYPNPMKDYTNFTFEHNKSNEVIKIQIYIYSFSGALVNILKAEGYASGFRADPLRWNGQDASGRQAGSGIYPYKVIVSGKNGTSAQLNGKLVIIK